jgi:hypothetical protein
MSHSHSFSTVIETDINSITYDLPKLVPGLKRRVFETGTLPNGLAYSIQGLNPKDAGACHALCEAEYANAQEKGKSYLLRRSQNEIEHMMDFSRSQRKGGIVLGAVLGDNRLAMIGAVDLIDDEKGMGRGMAYNADGACTAQQQVYFKMAVSHPAIRKENYNLAKMLYPYRLAIGLWFEERKCFLTKVSGKNVKEAYAKNGWELVDEYRLPEADDPAFDLTEDEKILNTYLLSREQAIHNLRENHHDVYQRYTELKDAYHDAYSPKNSITLS